MQIGTADPGRRHPDDDLVRARGLSSSITATSKVSPGAWKSAAGVCTGRRIWARRRASGLPHFHDVIHESERGESSGGDGARGALLIRVLVDDRAVLAVERGGTRYRLDARTLVELMRLSLEDARAAVDGAAEAVSETFALLPPVDEQEVWAAGVTYERSHAARVAESGSDVYTNVYNAERPELFLKATARRVASPGGAGRLRSDSTWDACEPELAVLVNSRREIVAYGVANDITSRSIEAENPLYLPQAKIYDDSCVLGHAWTPAWRWSPDEDRSIRLRLLRDDALVWSGETSTKRLRRRPEELVEWLFRETTFGDGVVLLTGTGIVAPDEIAYSDGDVVEITIDGLPALTHRLYRP